MSRRLAAQKYLDAMSKLASFPSTTDPASRPIPPWVNLTAPANVLEHLLEPVQELLMTEYAAVGLLEHWEQGTLQLFNRALQLPNFDWEVRLPLVMVVC